MKAMESILFFRKKNKMLFCIIGNSSEFLIIQK